MTFPHRKARSCPLLDGDCMTPHRDSSAKECRSPSFNIDSMGERHVLSTSSTACGIDTAIPGRTDAIGATAGQLLSKPHSSCLPFS